MALNAGDLRREAYLLGFLRTELNSLSFGTMV